MTRRIPPRAMLILAPIVLATGIATAGRVQLRDDPIWDKDISLNLLDAEVRQVFMLAFQIADRPVIIDSCVQGRVTLEFENVNLGDALTSLTRLGDWQVRSRSEGYYVGCVGAQPAPGDIEGEGHRLDFVLRDVTAGKILTRPSLVVRANSLAEIEAGGVQMEDLDDTGEFYQREVRATLRVKVFLDVAGKGAKPDSLRGLFDITAVDNNDPRLMRAAATGFEVALPPGSIDVAIAAVELGDHRYELTVTRE